MNREDMKAEQLQNRMELFTMYNQAFGGDNGKKVLDDLGGICYERWTTFDVSTASPQVLAFREGKRSVMLYIRSILNDDELKKEKEIYERRDS